MSQNVVLNLDKRTSSSQEQDHTSVLEMHSRQGQEGADNPARAVEKLYPRVVQTLWHRGPVRRREKLCGLQGAGQCIEACTKEGIAAFLHQAEDQQ